MNRSDRFAELGSNELCEHALLEGSLDEGNPPVRSLPESKKQMVLNVALRELVDKGYAGASTNAVAKKAGVAKGGVLLFQEQERPLSGSV